MIRQITVSCALSEVLNTRPLNDLQSCRNSSEVNPNFFQHMPVNLGVDVKISEDDRKILEKNL